MSIQLTTSTFTAFALALLLSSCATEESSDAYGNFEATTVVVSAKGSGELLRFDVTEGQQIQAGASVGLIDTTALHLERLQVLARAESVRSKTRDAGPQIAILKEQQRNLERERDRVARLLTQKAATQKQLDDINGQLDVVSEQITSAEREIATANRGIMSELKPLQAQLQMLDQRIADYQLENPVGGTVLTTFVEAHETVGQGAPLYKVAQLETLKLRAYTSADLLTGIQLGQQVTVLVDDGEKAYRELPGTIAWIASEAEFTPKSIATKQERVNLVYALEVAVVNDGTLRIGMPGEVRFNNSAATTSAE